jgi:branched-chain amino acid transport system ATP-binding protein
MSAALLSVREVTRRYGGVTAVDGVSLDVREGELVGLVGPNGAGKTTLFNAISGVAPPSDGRVLFRGQDLRGLAVHRIARLGMSRTFQNLRLFPALSVRDNVAIGAIGRAGASLRRSLLRAGSGGAAAQADAILARLDLAAHADRPAANLSYGGRKLLEIARALACEPTLLLLDEPAAGLNHTETARLGELLAGLCADGLTIVLVEHDMALVGSTCSRVAVLESGRLIADGSPARVMRDPAVVAAYLGTGAADA